MAIQLKRLLLHSYSCSFVKKRAHFMKIIFLPKGHTLEASPAYYQKGQIFEAISAHIRGADI